MESLPPMSPFQKSGSPYLKNFKGLKQRRKAPPKVVIKLKKIMSVKDIWYSYRGGLIFLLSVP